MTRPCVTQNNKHRRKKLMSSIRTMLGRARRLPPEQTELDLRHLDRMIGAALVEASEDAREEVYYATSYYED